MTNPLPILGRMKKSIAIRDALYVAENARRCDRLDMMLTVSNCDLSLVIYEILRTSQLGYTVFADDGEPVVIGGWIPRWGFVVQTWLVATHRALDVGITSQQAMAHGEAALIAAPGGVRRFEVVLNERSERQQLFRSHGYDIESRMPSFGKGGETAITMTRISHTDQARS